ncbi:TPA: hypothetical protein N0F65_007856 [Lagenidium giganteum]|uniref:Uncharacterized protein n=1 Tax=Lagenidium giganteum TaxID=4803 RepID=A0AAV2YG44_9STRA|nr:TPA: hypothetical protein N0F65_012983 [Lagenidium giganteum]DAZ93488.1 TPA: hypothetical protein N0F65_007856 [Lagenidium giganteum]
MTTSSSSATSSVGSRPRGESTGSRRRARKVKLSTSEERTGFARIYFKNQTFTSSTVFKLTSTTTVREVRKSMANKIKIPDPDLDNYVIVMVFPSNDSVAQSLSARTLRDEEIMLPLVERVNRARASTADTEDMFSGGRPKPKHRARPPLKFILKPTLPFPAYLGRVCVSRSRYQRGNYSSVRSFLQGIHSGYLQKASVKDPNVWRKRWFVVKDDQLIYCKSSSNQRDVTSISLLNAYLAKARPEVRVPFSFELRTPRRIYQLCANSKEDMVGWIQALHVQIGISTENHRLYEAEIIITEDAVSRNEEQVYVSALTEPSLLQTVLSREDTLKMFRDFVYQHKSHRLLETWVECELFRRNCIAREPSRPKRSAKDEWDHLKSIVKAVHQLPMITPDEIALLRQSFQSEQINRRLSIALHSETAMEYPRVEVIASIHQRIFQALEEGPFTDFLASHGYRMLLERFAGRII